MAASADQDRQGRQSADCRAPHKGLTLFEGKKLRVPCQRIDDGDVPASGPRVMPLTYEVLHPRLSVGQHEIRHSEVPSSANVSG